MQDVHQRARRGIRILVVRQVVLQLLALAGGIVVARGLGPGPLGVFVIVVFVVTVLGLVAELGMKTVLIRRAAAVTDRDLATSFTLRQILVTALVVLLFVSAPSLAAVYPRMPPEFPWLLRLLVLDLYLRSWRATSEVRLERELRYEALALADVVGSVGYQVVSIGLVLDGWGVEGLVWAALTGSVLRTVLLYRASPWPVRLSLDPAATRELIRVGVPLQASQIVSLAPAWVTPTLVAGLIGPEAVGLLNWAVGNGRKPLEVLENVVRVAVPHFARLQDDAGEVERILARYVVASLLVCGLWFAVLSVAGRDLVALVYTERWLPAIPALLVYAAAATLGSVRWITMSALIGLGRVRFIAEVTTVAAVVAVVASVVLVFWVGALGVPLGQLLGVAVAAPWLLTGLRPGAAARVLRGALPVFAPVAAAIAAGAVAILAPVEPAVRGLVTAAVMTTVYVGVAWWAGPEWLRAGGREELAVLAGRPGESGLP
jgi:O-antigen/teichoic acid export membrane protein